MNLRERPHMVCGNAYLSFIPIRNLEPADYGSLTPDECDRARRFRFAADRSRFVLARRLIRTIIGAAFDLDPQAVPIVIPSSGKPELPKEYGIGFNVSHSGQWIAAAFARELHVGIDIEEHRTDTDIDGIVRQHFTHEEAALVRRNPDSAIACFYRCWTLKEACLKATGSGLSAGISAVDVSACGASGLRRVPVRALRGESDVIAVEPIDAPHGYSAALAAEGLDWKTVVIQPWEGICAV